MALRISDKPVYISIKTMLKSVLREVETALPRLQALVLEMNGLVIHTYQFIRLYLLHCYHNNLSLPTITETWILYCLKTLGEKTSTGRKAKDTTTLKALQAFYREEYQPLLDHQKTSLVHRSNLLPYLATQIHTALSNNAQERFLSHFLRFLNKTTSEITEDRAILYQFKKQLLELDTETDTLFDEWKAQHLAQILPEEIRKSVPYDLKVEPLHYLRGMIYMNQVLEEQGHRLFQPLPLRTNIVPKHLTLDTACLVNLFCPPGSQKSTLFKQVKLQQDYLWHHLLRTERRLFRRKDYQFHHQLQTDGVSCVLLFIRKDFAERKRGSRLPPQEEDAYCQLEDLSATVCKELQERIVVGVDPGKRNLVFMADGEGHTLRYTAPQRKRESKAKTNQRILLQEKRRCQIQAAETRLSGHNSKSVDYSTFCDYLQAKDKCNRETHSFYNREVWRKMKFRQYSYAKRSQDLFLNRIEATFGPNPLLGYGNWSRSTQMKYSMPSLGRGMRRLIHKRYDTVTVNETRTSKTCNRCQGSLRCHKNAEGKRHWRLVTCSTCVRPEVKKIVFRTRDLNAAINIRCLAVSWIKERRRPEAFCLSPPSGGVAGRPS